MGKISEIIESGRAPGFVGNARMPAAESALKGLRAVEDEPLYKHGPTRGAKRIEKYMGMGSASFIRQKWEEPKPLKLRVKPSLIASIWLIASFLLLGSVRTAEAGYILAGEQISDGQFIHAADLLNLVGNATIEPGFISGQPLNPSPLASDYLIEYSPTFGNLYKIQLSTLFSSPQFFVTAPSGIPNYQTNDLFIFYSQSAAQVESIQYTNLLNAMASNTPVALWNFAPTNRNNGATNLFSLSQFPTPFSGNQTNNQPEMLIWGTNGTPYQIAFSNLEAQIALDNSTNADAYNQIFRPHSIYGTNVFFTNTLGYTNVVPITNLNMATASGLNTNQALFDGDKLPIDSRAMGINGVTTNTTATLSSLSQYFNYNQTIARIQFYNSPAAIGVTNWSSTTGIITNYAGAISWSNNLPVAVSWQGTNTGAQIPSTPQVGSNVLYYAVETNGIAAAPMGFQLFQNLNNAITRTSPILGNGVNPLKFGVLLQVTNITSLNADVIQLSIATGIRTGFYSVYFRTNAPSALYYMMGSAEALNGGSLVPIVCMSYDNVLTVSNLNIFSANNGGPGLNQLTHVMIFNQ